MRAAALRDAVHEGLTLRYFGNFGFPASALVAGLPASAAGFPASAAAEVVAAAVTVAEGVAVAVAVAVGGVVAAVAVSGGIGGAGGGVLSAPPQAIATRGTAQRAPRRLRMGRIVLRNAVEGNHS